MSKRGKWLRPNSRRGKYNARKTTVMGKRFDSKAESNRYLVLLEREQQREIYDLTCQPKFLLQEAFRYNDKAERAIYYVADFEYYTPDGDHVVEDVKGAKTKVYGIKRKLFLYRYPHITFREVKA